MLSRKPPGGIKTLAIVKNSWVPSVARLSGPAGEYTVASVVGWLQSC
jgi:hypothetical protein